MTASPKRARLQQRLGRDEGMTLVEMIIGVSASLGVIFAAYAAMAIVSNAQQRTEGRVDAAGRGRSTMEVITRDIRAQMCLPTKVGYLSYPEPAILWASGDGMQFYASVAPPAKGIGTAPPTTPGDTAPPEMRRIEWIQTGPSLNSRDTSALPVGKIVETIWQARETAPPYTFPTVTKTRTIATNIEHSRDASGNVLPLFRYYGFTIVNGTGRLSTTPYPLEAAPVTTMNPSGVPSVSDANERKIVSVSIDFSSRPPKQKITTATTGTSSRPTNVVPFSNQVTVRTADNYDPEKSPLCLS